MAANNCEKFKRSSHQQQRRPGQRSGRHAGPSQLGPQQRSPAADSAARPASPGRGGATAKRRRAPHTPPLSRTAPRRARPPTASWPPAHLQPAATWSPVVPNVNQDKRMDQRPGAWLQASTAPVTVAQRGRGQPAATAASMARQMRAASALSNGGATKGWRPNSGQYRSSASRRARPAPVTSHLILPTRFRPNLPNAR